MVYCTECGNPIEESAKFCPSCGAAQHPSAVMTRDGARVISATDRPPKRARKMMLRIAAVLVIVAVGFLAILYAIGSSEISEDAAVRLDGIHVNGFAIAPGVSQAAVAEALGTEDNRSAGSYEGETHFGWNIEPGVYLSVDFDSAGGVVEARLFVAVDEADGDSYFAAYRERKIVPGETLLRDVMDLLPGGIAQESDLEDSVLHLYMVDWELDQDTYIGFGTMLPTGDYVSDADPTGAAVEVVSIGRPLYLDED